MSLQMAVEFLKRWVFEISEIKIMNNKTVDEKLGNLYQLC
jgi:hypothetical protein